MRFGLNECAFRGKKEDVITNCYLAKVMKMTL